MGTAVPVPADTFPSPRPESAETRDHLRVAPDAGRRRLRARLLMVAIALVTVASLFTLVGFRVVAAQSAFTLDRLSKERTNEQLRYERLREEVSRRSAPEAVISAARARGMIPAPRREFLQAAAAAPRNSTPATSQSLSANSYDKTKKALDQNP
jgi:hypothetical protein